MVNKGEILVFYTYKRETMAIQSSLFNLSLIVNSFIHSFITSN